jgi:hypothetical protein
MCAASCSGSAAIIAPSIQAEFEAAEQLRKASEIIMQNPAGLELRRMQMITEVGAEQNTMTIIMMPSEFVAMAKSIAGLGKPSSQ